jgi:hypothetical protein
MNPPGDKDRVYPRERHVVDVMHGPQVRRRTSSLHCLPAIPGLRPGTKHGPRHFSWFKTVAADYFRQEREQSYSAVAACANRETLPGLDKEVFERMTDAIEVVAQDAGSWRFLGLRPNRSADAFSGEACKRRVVDPLGPACRIFSRLY